MNEFFLGAAVSAGGAWVMNQIDTSQVLSQQQASCTSQGGTWQTASSGTSGTCRKSGAAINTTYYEWGVVVDLGIPLLAAVLITRSGSGIFGALAGAAVVFLIGVSQIH